MYKPDLGYAANLQNINFIHSQCFVQLLFGYILNKKGELYLIFDGKY
jgi:hypothetical protein